MSTRVPQGAVLRDEVDSAGSSDLACTQPPDEQAARTLELVETSDRSQLPEMPTRDPDRPSVRMLSPEIRDVQIGRHALPGRLGVPSHPLGHVIFAHGSGSSRLSPRNTHAAQRLRQSGYATLLFDLLTSIESGDRRNVFDIPLLASRVVEAIAWTRSEPRVANLAIGLFGASTGAAAAIVAAARQPNDVRAVVSRGGRPDLANQALAQIAAPTLLIVGGEDHEVIALNRSAQSVMRCPTKLVIIPGAGHLFEEPGTLDAALDAAIAWFDLHLRRDDAQPGG